MHGAGPGSLRIPSFVDDVISAMKQMGGSFLVLPALIEDMLMHLHGSTDMSIEGIFRKNGNIRRLKDVSEALDRDSSSINLSDENPVQLAALLKKFLRDLPDPLMTFKLFHLFIAAQRESQVLSVAPSQLLNSSSDSQESRTRLNGKRFYTCVAV